jgi:hypothetical protein
MLGFEDFLCSGAYVAVVAQDGREFVRIFPRDCGDSSE